MCWLCAVPLCTPIFPHKPRGSCTVVWKEGRRRRGCGSVSECHMEQEEWNNGSNIADPPPPPLPSYSHTLLTRPHLLFHSLLMTHRPHTQHLDAHEPLYNGGGGGMERKWKNSRVAIQIQSQVAFLHHHLFVFVIDGKQGHEEQQKNGFAIFASEKQRRASAERSPHTVGNSFQCGGRSVEGTIDWERTATYG